MLSFLDCLFVTLKYLGQYFSINFCVTWDTAPPERSKTCSCLALPGRACILLSRILHVDINIIIVCVVRKNGRCDIFWD